MAATSTTFRLAARDARSVACSEDGLFVGGTALLARTEASRGARRWQPRPLPELNDALSRLYRAPIDVAGKLGGLSAVAKALDAGDIALAQIAALQLRLPDAPADQPGGDDVVRLVRGLLAGGLLAKTFDPEKHPHWPAGSPGSVGGQFMPAGGVGGAGGSDAPAAAQRAAPGARHGDRQPHQAHPAPTSQLASSLNRTPQALSPPDQALLTDLQHRLRDPANDGVVYFDDRDDALRDMGYCFSADITKYDLGSEQFERAGWLVYDPVKKQWWYDRSQMVVSLDPRETVIRAGTANDAVHAGNAIYVHIHPLIDESNRVNGDPSAAEDNANNRTFSRPITYPSGDRQAGDTTLLSDASKTLQPFHVPLHAAVIGSDGSISYAEGGVSPSDYEGKNVIPVAPRGTIPMRNPNP